MNYEASDFNQALREGEALTRTGREKIADGVRRLAAAELMRARRAPSFSLVRAIQCMTSDGSAGLRDGIEAEVAQEAARQAGRSHDINRPTFPWGVLMGERVMITGTGSSGGYLVDGTGVPTVADALAPWSVTMRAGLTVLEGLRGNVQIPRELTTAAGQWLPTETTQGTAANLTVGAAALTPKSAISYVEMSRDLLRQGPLAEGLVARSLGRAMATLVDQSVFSGTSTDSSVPLGIRYQAGVVVVTGTALTYANLRNEQEQISLGNVQDANHVFTGHPTVRELLGGRAVGTSSGIAPFCWENDKILNRPAYATTDVGTGQIVHGDFSQVAFGLWGGGFTIEHNPYAAFQAGISGFRCMVSCDVGMMQPTAVRVVTGIT